VFLPVEQEPVLKLKRAGKVAAAQGTRTEKQNSNKIPDSKLFIF
jgi:hypothetical protein